MSKISRDRLQLGPFPKPLKPWHQDLIDLFIETAEKDGLTVVRIDVEPYLDDPGSLTVVVPTNQPHIERAAPIAVERDR